MILSTVVEYDQEATGEKFRDITEAMGVAATEMDQDASCGAAIDAVRKLSADVGILAKLDALKEENLDFLLETAYAVACREIRKKLLWGI